MSCNTFKINNNDIYGENPLKFIEKYCLHTLKETAKLGGFCESVIKKFLRKHGIERWPSRKFISIQKMIDHGTDEEKRRAINAREQLLKNPDIRLTHFFTKSQINSINNRISKMETNFDKFPANIDLNKSPTGLYINPMKFSVYKVNLKPKKTKLPCFAQRQNSLSDALAKHVDKPDKLVGFNIGTKQAPIILDEREETMDMNSKLIFLDDTIDEIIDDGYISNDVRDTIEQIARDKSMHPLTDIEKECVSILCDTLFKTPVFTI
jgi:hypothetical protein